VRRHVVYKYNNRHLIDNLESCNCFVVKVIHVCTGHGGIMEIFVHFVIRSMTLATEEYMSQKLVARRKGVK